jgi:hypothetical protein
MVPRGVAKSAAARLPKSPDRVLIRYRYDPPQQQSLHHVVCVPSQPRLTMRRQNPIIATVPIVTVLIATHPHPVPWPS